MASKSQIWGNSDKDVIKFIVLFLFNHGLLEEDNKRVIQDQILILVNILNAFNHYP